MDAAGSVSSQADFVARIIARFCRLLLSDVLGWAVAQVAMLLGGATAGQIDDVGSTGRLRAAISWVGAR